MSDFVTRLVERQAGTAAMVRPRIPSMFAPPIGRTEPAEFPVIDSSAPIAVAGQTLADSIRPSDHREKVLTHTDQQEGRRPVLHSSSSPHAAAERRRAESAPIPLVRNASAIVNQAVRTTPPADSMSTPEQRRREQKGLNWQHMEDPVDPAPSHSTARLAPPPLVNVRHDTARSSAAAPPSLVGTLADRRTGQNHAPSTEGPVEVTIGRIEVTAVSAAPDQKRKSGARRPAMSLEEYLTRRQGGRP